MEDISCQPRTPAADNYVNEEETWSHHIFCGPFVRAASPTHLLQMGGSDAEGGHGVCIGDDCGGGQRSQGLSNSRDGRDGDRDGDSDHLNDADDDVAGIAHDCDTNDSKNHIMGY